MLSYWAAGFGQRLGSSSPRYARLLENSRRACLKQNTISLESFRCLGLCRKLDVPQNGIIRLGLTQAQSVSAFSKVFAFITVDSIGTPH
jgi:hypothetical protein